MKYIILLLLSITVHAQSKPIVIKIDSIATTETEDNRRTFKLHYQITNISKKEISFVLDLKKIIPIGSGSLRPNPYYKVYENEMSLEVNGIFTGEKQVLNFKNEAEMNRYQDSITASIKNKTPEQWQQEKKEYFLNNIQKMQPNEVKHFDAVIVWDKNRYHRNGDIEYFIEEKEKHFIELHINLMVEELLLSFSEAEKNELLKDTILTKGWFTSNKIEINLGE
ncbi:hypothetical protein [Flavobacterium sp.]|uniref:hypothetical protein n=1 Tax=Flavobacterium sp. TaxID=239 RepID=UPI0025F08E78|nr:hypothetical protein [Flavobacterium sp.]